MAQDPLQALRLACKRTFTAYYLELSSPGIADPTQAFGSCDAYLSALFERLGPREFMRRLDDETTHMAGQIEQDLRHRGKRGGPTEQYEDLEDRLRESFEYALGRLRERGCLEGDQE